ncbi:MAG: NAD(P)-dependent glycerol-1-phosphate dehydrogenase [Candidatus Bathyarchaeia archaeon]
MQLPREVIIGNGAINYIPEICKRLGFEDRALIVTGNKTYEIAGRSIQEKLNGANIKSEIFIVESATLACVWAVEERIKALNPDVVFGVGGGTKIDVAKLASANMKVPVISVPTTASHDGIASPLSSVKGLQKPFSIKAQTPIAIIADTNLIRKAPYRLVASGCGDVIAKITAVSDWKLAHEELGEYYGDYAASLALMSAKLVMENAEVIRSKSEEGLRVLLEALISCGVAMSIAGSSRPCSGSEHLFSHALDVIKPNCSMHGERCAVGTIMMAYLHGADWMHIRDTLKILGAPTTANELGVTAEEIGRALFMASSIRPERYTILNKLNLSFEECLRIAKITGVI